MPKASSLRQTTYGGGVFLAVRNVGMGFGRADGHLTLNEVAMITRLQMLYVKQNENIGTGKCWIPAGFAANLRAEAHISFEQWRHPRLFAA